MTKMWLIQIFLVFIFTIFGIGCDKKPEATSGNDVTNKSELSATVAEVNGEVILQSELDAMLQQHQQQAAAMKEKVPDRDLVLVEMINSALLLQYAKNTRIDQGPEVKAVLKRAQTEVLLQIVRHKILTDKPVTNDEINSRLGVPSSSELNKSGKGNQLAAEQQLRAQIFRTLQKERVDELLNDLRGKAHIVVN